MKKVLCYFWIFVMTSYLGSLVETIWCFIKNKRIESRRGVIYEPMIPIYGISGTLIMIVAKIFNLSKWYEVFGIGFLISSVVEFFSSFVQEKVFATKSWDYSEFPLNLGGRVNCFYSIMFGMVALCSYKFILYPFFKIFMGLEMSVSLLSVSLLMIIFMMYDFFISAIAVYRMKERRSDIVREGCFWNYIDKKYNDKFLQKVYPNMVEI